MIAALPLGMLLAAVLWLIAAIHAYWGMGGVWPARDATALARAVVGARGIKTMPGPVPCLIVALLLLAAGFWPLVMLDAITVPFVPRGLVAVAGWLLMFVFLGRGIASYIPALRRFGPEQPFARYDRLFYGPLCLLIGAGFLFLLIQGQ
jgi:hypothetical protein